MLIDVVRSVQTRVEKLERGLTSANQSVDEKVGALTKRVFTLQLIHDTIMEKGVNALKQWTKKASATVIYDSTVDEFTHDGLINKVKGKPNIAIIGFTTDGNVFGGFYSVAVTEQKKDFNDRNIFAFSFESGGRCMTPQRFMVKEEHKEIASVRFFEKSNSGIVGLWVYGTGGFCLGNERSNSYCWNMSRAFEGLENTTLTGQSNTNYNFPPYHHCTRLVAIQLE